MKLTEFIEKNEWDGELVLNGVNFDMTCSFCINKMKCSDKAVELHEKVLNAELVSIEGNYVHFHNNDFNDQDEAWLLGNKFLKAISGYISDTLYKECFIDID